MDGFTFEQPAAIRWLWLAAFAALLAWWGWRQRHRALARLADPSLRATVAPGFRPGRRLVRDGLTVGAIALLAFSLMDPRWGATYEEVRRRGMDVVFIVDVSRSMLARDAKPDRLTRAKQFVADAVEGMAGDRVGLVAFAGGATLASPLTLNYGAFRLALEELTPLDSLRGGSMLGDAIRLAAASFTDTEPGGKAIVILSDGEDMESFPAEAAAKAYGDAGIRVFTIGLGDATDGARIPIGGEGAATRWLVFEGQEVWSRMDPDTLTAIALAGDGAFVPAGTAQVDMAEVFDAVIAASGRRDLEQGTVRRATPRFAWFAGVALVLLVLEGLLAVTGWRAARRAEVPA